ncbi:hypothetical protein CRG98_029952 [Punica granatum]|uniref:Uncharacterized protein n=1 Tax=Punica granatum TaxID=22663 RepID=A0A2I0J0C7_PUNGR|nr:hypothetical protein CRG98_029952 [Punica granatum]
MHFWASEADVAPRVLIHRRQVFLLGRSRFVGVLPLGRWNGYALSEVGFAAGRLRFAAGRLRFAESRPCCWGGHALTCGKFARSRHLVLRDSSSREGALTYLVGPGIRVVPNCSEGVLGLPIVLEKDSALDG